MYGSKIESCTAKCANFQAKTAAFQNPSSGRAQGHIFRARTPIQEDNNYCTCEVRTRESKTIAVLAREMRNFSGKKLALRLQDFQISTS